MKQLILGHKFRLYWALIFIGFFSHLNVEAAALLKWEKFYEEEGISLFRAPRSQSGLIPFKAQATFEGNVQLYLAALLDYKNKPKWAPKLKEVVVHKTVAANTFVFSEYYQTPWPATDREFLLKGEVMILGEGDNKSYKLVASNYKDNELSKTDHITCDVSHLNLLLTPITAEKTFISFEFLGDMKGWMPNWLINIIQKKWPLRFLQGLRDYVKEANRK